SGAPVAPRGARQPLRCEWSLLRIQRARVTARDPRTERGPMPPPHLLEALRDQVLLCDGGMGSRVQALSLDIEKDYWGRENCTEVLNLSRPDLVRDIHRGYYAAGADMVETNSFGGSPVTLGEFDLQDRAFEINRIAG